MENIKMTEWKVIKLGDVADIIGGGTPDTKNDSYWGGDVPWLTPKDLSGYGSRHISKGERNISYQGLTNSSAKMLPAGSVLLTSRAPIGYVAIAKTTLCTNQGFKSLVLKENADSEFFYYLLKNNVDYIQGMSSGSTFAEISGSQVKALEFKIPPLDVQKRIAGILGALDDRIDVLRRENVVLEQMAQAVFQSWFVDFDIVRAKAAGTPESEVCEKYHITPELYALFPSALTPDNLPLGWEKKKLGEVILCFDSKRIPLSKKQREEMKGGVPYYGATSIVDYVNKEIFDDVYLLMGEDGSVIDENGKPFLQYIWGKAWINNHAHVLQGKRMVSTETLYLFLKNFNIRPYVTGAVQAKLNQQNMNSIPFVYASESIHNIFHERISSFFSKIRCNTEQTRTLEQTRDTLLPQLISGKIDVENVPLPHSGE